MLTFLRQPWHIAGFARQGCRTNWLFGIDGGNQKERHFTNFFKTCSDGRIRDLWFYNRTGLFLHNSFDVCCLLCSCWFLNKNMLFTLLKRLKIHCVMFGLKVWCLSYLFIDAKGPPFKPPFKRKNSRFEHEKYSLENTCQTKTHFGG